MIRRPATNRRPAGKDPGEKQGVLHHPAKALTRSKGGARKNVVIRRPAAASEPSATTGKNNKLLLAAGSGDLAEVHNLLAAGAEAHYQRARDGRSVLMAAAADGHVEVVQALLAAGAPWNAVDRKGKCAGTLALEQSHQAAVDEIVKAGVAAELMFHALEDVRTDDSLHIQHDSYLKQNVRYEHDALLDDADRGVMMEWEAPIMRLHAQLLCEGGNKDVLNIGFGMGFVDTFIQDFGCRSHTIIEAHPQVHQKMINDGWSAKQGVKIVHARWQDVVDSLGSFDAVYFDTFGDVNHLHEFHVHLPKLVRVGGTYSFFNGICPNNIIFQGVACEVIKMDLEKLGFTTEFTCCDISSGDDQTWEHTAFRYYVRSDYHLPTCKRVR